MVQKAGGPGKKPVRRVSQRTRSASNSPRNITSTILRWIRTKTAYKSFTHGFGSVFESLKNEPYSGDATFVMLVWHRFQIVPAEQWRNTNLARRKKVDLVVCADPKVLFAQLGSAKSMIYGFSAKGGGGGDFDDE